MPWNWIYLLGVTKSTLRLSNWESKVSSQIEAVKILKNSKILTSSKPWILSEIWAFQVFSHAHLGINIKINTLRLHHTIDNLTKPVTKLQLFLSILGLKKVQTLTFTSLRVRKTARETRRGWQPSRTSASEILSLTRNVESSEVRWIRDAVESFVTRSA